MIIELYPQLSYIINKNYKMTNTAISLLCALNEIGTDDDILWINGDVFFDNRILNRILECPNTCIAVNNFEVQDEEVKYKVDDNNFIIEISKEVACPEGESVGIHKMNKDDLLKFIKYLSLCESGDYFERGIELAIKNGLLIKPIDVSDLFCIEVDFPKDLEIVNQALSKNGY